MEPVLSSNPESLLERAYVDAVEQVADLDEARSRVLDAAYDQFSRLGIQRSTMEDVARRAGVSRITVYRRFATKDALVEQVIRREFRRYFDRFLIDIEQAETAADRVVLGFVSSMRAIRSNTLIGGLMATEPDTVLPTMINDEGGRSRRCAGSSRASSAASSAPGPSRTTWTSTSWPR